MKPVRGKKTKKKMFEIAVPVKETWYFTVEAASKEEALEKYHRHSSGVEQTCSMGGWPNRAGKTEVEELK